MNILKAIGLGIVLWVLIFVEVSVLMFGLKLSGLTYSVVHGILLTIFAFVLSFIYFSGKNRKKGKRIAEGLSLGFTWLLISIILDSLITVPYFIIPNGGSYLFLLSPEILIGELWGIIICMIMGSVKK